MKSRKVMVGILAMAGVVGVGSALAQPGGCGPEGMGQRAGMMRDGAGGPMAGMRDPGARAEKRLARLKEQLKLTPQQEPLWLAFAEKSKAEAEKGAKGMRERMAGGGAATAPERMAQMQGMMQERLASMQSVSESFNRLYSALTPEQKAVADSQFAAGPGQHGRGHRGPGRSGEGWGPDARPQEPRKG